jgi:hypothetical protein
MQSAGIFPPLNTTILKQAFVPTSHLARFALRFKPSAMERGWNFEFPGHG